MIHYTWAGLCFSVLTLPVFMLLFSMIIKERPVSGTTSVSSEDGLTKENKSNRRMFRKIWRIFGWGLLLLSSVTLFLCYRSGYDVEYASNISILLVLVEVFGAILPLLLARRSEKKKRKE